MRKTFWSILTLAAALACVAAVRAEDPKPADKAPGVDQRQEQRKEEFRTAIEKKDFDKALSVLDVMVADKDVSDEEKFMAQYFQFRLLTSEKHDGAKACPIAKKLSEIRKDDPEFLNDLAWTILDSPKLKNRDLDLALAIAKKAADASKHEDAAVLDTLARAYFEKGDLDKAVETQTLAVEKSKSNAQTSEAMRKETPGIAGEIQSRQGQGEEVSRTGWSHRDGVKISCMPCFVVQASRLHFSRRQARLLHHIVIAGGDSRRRLRRLWKAQSATGVASYSFWICGMAVSA